MSKKRTVGFRFDEETLRILAILAAQRKSTRTKVIIELVKAAGEEVKE